MRLCDVPVGLFLFEDTLCLMTEYSNEGCGREAYIVSSGETFWGGAKSKEERANLDVTPVTVKQDDLRPKGRWEEYEDGKFRCSVCGKKPLEIGYRTLFVPAVCYHCGADMRGGGEE